jgi:hypothetical protein
VERLYSANGMPGCVGSMDCVGLSSHFLPRSMFPFFPIMVPSLSCVPDFVFCVFQRKSMTFSCWLSCGQVHVPWDRCSFADRSWYTGKEKIPTVAYEVTCDHSRKILHATAGYPGSINDKTISAVDGLVYAVRTHSAFTDFRFKLCNGDGGMKEDHVGGWILVDGGYTCFE